MKKNDTHVFIVRSRAAPIVEIDTEAGAAYVRFKRARVAKTLRHRSKWPIVTIDLDASGEVIGIEFVGVKKYNLEYLLKRAPIKVPSSMLEKASYVAPEWATGS
jgi:uncharacterized protein YuzE